MSDEPKALYQLGGLSFVASGSLFFAKYVFDLVSGPPPSTGAEILQWTTAKRLPLSMISEILFFAAMFLVPAVIALYQHLAATDRVKAAVGCGILAAAIPVLAATLIVHGRLVFPIYDLRIASPAVAELVVAIFYGGLHAVWLLFAVATVALSLAMRRGFYGAKIAWLGFATAVFDVIGSYPDKIGPILILVSQVLLTAWFVAVGAKLYRAR
ncbi:MAG: hypothetical protein ACXWCN_18185 [Caldimonas sp.]